MDYLDIKEFYDKLEEAIDSESRRSAWKRGVHSYATELIEGLRDASEYTGKIPSTVFELEKMALNGAEDWKQFSYGGCSLIYDEQIAVRLCAPWELRLSKRGRLQPSKQETWLDVQARALYQACMMLRRNFGGVYGAFGNVSSSEG